MSQSAEINTFLKRLGVLYGPPETPDPKAFLKEYENLLKNYSPQVIARAADYVRDHHTYRSWPTPGEVREALLKVAPPVVHTDWDAEEAERRKGWEFSDLGKAAKDDASRARVQAMVDEFKRNLSANKVDTKDPLESDWATNSFHEMQRSSRNRSLHALPGGLTQTSRRMTGERSE